MKKLNFIKTLFCLFLVFTLSIGTASAKMFGTTCGYEIGTNANGECTIEITRTTYVFWVAFPGDTAVYLCDWGLTVDQLCA